MKKKLLLLFILPIFLTSFGQMTTYNYDFNGVNRQFNIHIPSSYNASTDTLPLVLFLHGMGGNMSNFSGLSYKSDAEKFIMVVPQALVDPQVNQTAWHSGAGGTIGSTTYYINQNVDDVGFISSLIDTISKWYTVDADRIYSTGFSMGAYMTNRLGCELSNKIAAIASVSGTFGNEISNTCSPNNIVPALHIHSISDATVSYYNNNYGTNAEDVRDFWIANNHCDTIPIITDLTNIASDNWNTTKYLYNGGDLNSEVEFYKLEGPQHNESWFTATSGNDFDAIEVIWDFFKRHKKEHKLEELEPNSTRISSIKDVELEIFPNPASNFISLNFSNKTKVSTISIANILGKTISSKSFDKVINKATFNISNQSKGVYFFRIEDVDGNKTVIRFYKN